MPKRELSEKEKQELISLKNEWLELLTSTRYSELAGRLAALEYNVDLLTGRR